MPEKNFFDEKADWETDKPKRKNSPITTLVRKAKAAFESIFGSVDYEVSMQNREKAQAQYEKLQEHIKESKEKMDLFLSELATANELSTKEIQNVYYYAQQINSHYSTYNRSNEDFQRTFAKIKALYQEAIRSELNMPNMYDPKKAFVEVKNALADFIY